MDLAIGRCSGTVFKPISYFPSVQSYFPTLLAVATIHEYHSRKQKQTAAGQEMHSAPAVNWQAMANTKAELGKARWRTLSLLSLSSLRFSHCHRHADMCGCECASAIASLLSLFSLIFPLGFQCHIVNALGAERSAIPLSLRCFGC